MSGVGGDGDGDGRPRLDHVGVAVFDLENRLNFYTKALGLTAVPTETIETEQVRVAFLPLGDTRLELLEPTAEESSVARFLDRRGEGIHHLCIEIEDLDATLARLQAEKVSLVDDVPRPGAEGSRVAFIHPSGTGGVLIELKQRGTR
ncbi:MAG: methylmalonyl-CoA epimerase [Acidobacteriota bacterium]